MNISFIKALDEEKATDAIVIPFFEVEGVVTPASNIGSLEKDIEFILDLGDFKGKPEEILSTYLFHRPQKRLILFGIGNPKKFNLESYRRSLAKALEKALKLNVKSFQYFLPDSKNLDLSQEACCYTTVETLFLMNYEFEGYKHNFEKKSFEKLYLITDDFEKFDKLNEVTSLVEGVNLARDLVNTNADTACPEYVKDVAYNIHKDHSDVKIKVLERKELEKEEMNLFLSVARGSHLDPYVVIIEYKGAKNSDLHPIIIGKGITYDTGGLSLKPTSNMIEMKSDMGGSAVALGVIKSVAAMKLPVNLTCVCPLAENAIGPNSYKIGDVYTGKGKISVEVTNTDAEGRLALADAISYSIEKLKPTHIIDVATLTGACEIALGSERAALFSNNQELSDNIFASGEETGEKVWEMPIDSEYKEILASKIADIKNSGVRAGSLIASAIFLKEFVKEDINWAHLDIAGTTYLSNPRRYHRSRATGYGVRLLVQTLKNLFKV